MAQHYDELSNERKTLIEEALAHGWYVAQEYQDMNDYLVLIPPAGNPARNWCSSGERGGGWAFLDKCDRQVDVPSYINNAQARTRTLVNAEEDPLRPVLDWR